MRRNLFREPANTTTKEIYFLRLLQNRTHDLCNSLIRPLSINIETYMLQYGL